VSVSKPIVVIGCSYGCIPALQRLVSQFGAGWPTAVCITLHVGPFSQLPEVLQARCALPVRHAEDQESIETGRVYVAPPDHHLCVERHALRLTRGPKENWCRPAIDPMFRSAAQSHGPAVVGVLMTGLLSDGSLGLVEIHKRRGRTIIQDPEEAEAADMPLSALSLMCPDFVLPLSEMRDGIWTCLQTQLASGAVG
jgi:two-component system chemotaxis response regulator CheB